MIKDAIFKSIWDGGYEVATKCKVNLKTKEVFDIEAANPDVDILEKEYVTIDEVDYSVSNIDGQYMIEDGCLEKIRQYIENIALDDYELDGVEITDSDFRTILKRVNSTGEKLEKVTHEYLIEIREVLDIGLDDSVEMEV